MILHLLLRSWPAWFPPAAISQAEKDSDRVQSQSTAQIGACFWTESLRGWGWKETAFQLIVTFWNSSKSSQTEHAKWQIYVVFISSVFCSGVINLINLLVHNHSREIEM